MAEEQNNEQEQKKSENQADWRELLKALPPLKRLELFAKAVGVKINPPNKDCPVCKGEGYLEVHEDGTVQPCMCIYPGFGGVKANRETRRKLAKKTRKVKNG